LIGWAPPIRAPVKGHIEPLGLYVVEINLTIHHKFIIRGVSMYTTSHYITDQRSVLIEF
jgi:hypothetical protein